MTGENVAVALFCIGNVDIIFNVVMWNICRVCIILSDLEKTNRYSFTKARVEKCISIQT